MSAILITGGCGFIGINLANRLLSSGHNIQILDNLSRPNVTRNLAWLMRAHGDRALIEVADVRDRTAVRRVVHDVDHVFHLAAQVAVTSSVQAPEDDFDTNVRGTLNLLEEIRSVPDPPSLIYTSTNKVYGCLDHIPMHIEGKRYMPDDRSQHAISEACPLSFHSPYGCSKGAAEQYVLDYHRTFGLKTAVFRMSCIFGPRQFGTEDQGWVAHLMSQMILRRPITIYGDGRQVRDLLFIDDLLNAFILAWQDIDRLSGRAFNIGGGPNNSVSLLELLDELKYMKPDGAVHFENWRVGDQKYYVSDTRKFQAATGWTPLVNVTDGLHALHGWLTEVHGADVVPALRHVS